MAGLAVLGALISVISLGIESIFDITVPLIPVRTGIIIFFVLMAIELVKFKKRKAKEA